MNRQTLNEAFYKIYGSDNEPDAFFAPGRVNLIGEHTDYNGGHVFPCALTFGTYGLARKRSDRKLNFYSENFSDLGVISSSLDDLTPCREDNWTSYPKGVIWAFEKYGHRITDGMDLYVYGDIPNGSGLSSSASLEVLMGTILCSLYNIDDVTMTQVALLSQYAENNYNKMNCGIMDQFASAMGKKDHAIFLDTDTLKYEYVPVQLDDVSLVITNSNVKHSLVSSAYNDRRNECEKGLAILQKTVEINSLGELSKNHYDTLGSLISDETIRRRVRHAVYENQRTIEAVKALKKGDLSTFGELMNQSHLSLRDDYEVSCPEIDLLVETAWKQPGVLGSRMTGGGFGGCTVSLVRQNEVDAFKRALNDAYVAQTGKKPDFYIAKIGDGAGRLK